MQELERKLSYEDLRFYRSIAHSQARKDEVTRKRLEEERNKNQPPAKGWSSWLWGSTTTNLAGEGNAMDAAFDGNMTDDQRKELYEALDFDEDIDVKNALQAPRDAVKLRVAATLSHGSLALRSDPHNRNAAIMSVAFEAFGANFIQRTDNFEASISLGGLGVFDGTTPDTIYSQIVTVRKSDLNSTVSDARPGGKSFSDDPFFFVRFENQPLDERADTALTVKMRHMEIIYHRGYVEAVVRFFKPPESQLESVEALLVSFFELIYGFHISEMGLQSVATQTFEEFRKETRVGLEYALQTHKTIDIQLDMNAPIIIVPERYYKLFS